MFRLIAVTLAVFAMESAAVAQTPVERGSYLVNAVMACDGCHRRAGRKVST